MQGVGEKVVVEGGSGEGWDGRGRGRSWGGRD